MDPTHEQPAVLQTRALNKSYYLGREEIRVLTDISLTVLRCEYIAIMGHSGAGKTTLLNILGCLDTPTSGEYLFGGVAISSMSRARLTDIRNRDIGFVFQSYNLLPRLTVFQNIELPLIYAGLPPRKRRDMVEETMERFGIAERRRHRPNEISGGQKQRVAIARALVKSPSIILADEPTGNLDSTTTGEILDILDRVHRDGNTILVITHERDVAGRAGRILHLSDGRISA